MPSTIDFNAIIQRMEAAQKAANEANLLRYEQLLQAIGDLGAQTHGTYQEAFQNIEGLGTAARQRVQQGKIRGQARAEQDLISRGLGNTTIRGGAMRGIAEDAERQQQAIDEAVGSQRSSLLQGRAGMEAQIGGMRAGAIEGRRDIGPDMSLMASLLQAAASQGDQTPIRASVGRGLPPGGGGVSRGSGGGGSLADSLRATLGGGSGGSIGGTGATIVSALDTPGARQNELALAAGREEQRRTERGQAQEAADPGLSTYRQWLRANPTAGPRARRIRMQEFGVGGGQYGGGG